MFVCAPQSGISILNLMETETGRVRRHPAASEHYRSTNAPLLWLCIQMAVGVFYLILADVGVLVGVGALLVGQVNALTSGQTTISKMAAARQTEQEDPEVTQAIPTAVFLPATS